MTITPYYYRVFEVILANGLRLNFLPKISLYLRAALMV